MVRILVVAFFTIGVPLLVLLVGCGGGAGSIAQDVEERHTQGNITSINHVIIFMQENRSFDEYFGQMNEYRREHGIPGTVNDLSTGNYSNVSPATGRAIAAYHSGSVCTENLSPEWAESLKMIDLHNTGEARMDGFVAVAYGLSEYLNLTDQTGKRAMGYFDDDQLNYYYFMASQFAMSDNFFSPVPTNTTPNRLYMHAATSQGHIHVPESVLTAKTIWQLLDEKGVSWKIYYTDEQGTFLTFLQYFSYYGKPGVKEHVLPVSQYFEDLKNGTLPAVAFIETGYRTGRDEHPSNKDGPDGVVHVINVQTGAAYAAQLINALMNSSSWKDSVFFFLFDEGGGPFDHVPPIKVPNPDGIKPLDYEDKDRHGDFTLSGFRVPNFIVSPFARKHYVSKTPMDFTAILKFIATRWGLANLTARDASMPDMTEFFEFADGGPWAIPPKPPEQRRDGTCSFAVQ